jgi:hypothetical protein
MTAAARARAGTSASHSSMTPPVDESSSETSIAPTTDLIIPNPNGGRYSTRSAHRKHASTSSRPSPPAPKLQEPVIGSQFFSPAPVLGVHPPQPRPDSPGFENSVDIFQERIAAAMLFDPPRRAAWNFGCIKRTGFAAVPSPPYLNGPPGPWNVTTSSRASLSSASGMSTPPGLTASGPAFMNNTDKGKAPMHFQTEFTHGR